MGSEDMGGKGSLKRHQCGTDLSSGAPRLSCALRLWCPDAARHREQEVPLEKGQVGDGEVGETDLPAVARFR